MSDRASKAAVDAANQAIISFAAAEGIETDDDCNGKLMAPLGGPLRGCWLTWGHNDPTSRLFFCVVTRERSTLSHGHATPDGAHVAALARVRGRPCDEPSAESTQSAPIAPTLRQWDGMSTEEWAMRIALARSGWGALQWSGRDAPAGTLRARLHGDHALSARFERGEMVVEIDPPWSGWLVQQVATPADALRVVSQWERQHAQRARASNDAAETLRAMIGDECP